MEVVNQLVDRIVVLKKVLSLVYYALKLGTIVFLVLDLVTRRVLLRLGKHTKKLNNTVELIKLQLDFF